MYYCIVNLNINQLNIKKYLGAPNIAITNGYIYIYIYVYISYHRTNYKEVTLWVAHTIS